MKENNFIGIFVGGAALSKRIGSLMAFAGIKVREGYGLSETSPFSATDFYQILETSDVPAGVVNIITGGKDELTNVQ